MLYTEYPWLRAHTPLLSLWAYRSWWREPGRQAIARSADGGQAYWLDRSDPRLNTLLPGTPVSVMVDLSDAWARRPDLVSSERMPPACVIGALNLTKQTARERQPRGPRGNFEREARGLWPPQR